MKTKLTPRFWTALILFSLIGQVAWVVENMYLNSNRVDISEIEW